MSNNNYKTVKKIKKQVDNINQFNNKLNNKLSNYHNNFNNNYLKIQKHKILDKFYNNANKISIN